MSLHAQEPDKEKKIWIGSVEWGLLPYIHVLYLDYIFNTHATLGGRLGIGNLKREASKKC
uniref:Uncharacterized protein n=1 Tax=Romanomermis culicivorax TaxID=13658 RepID=A0A915J5U5_ROMCU